MAEIIEEELLPVTIRKVRIGRKDLSKKIIDQLAWGNFVYFKHEDGSIEFGLPYIINNESDELIFDKTKPYVIDGTLIGYIVPTWDDAAFVRKYLASWGEFNRAGRLYFILWYDKNNRLKKGYIDDWTLQQLNIDIFSMQIII